MYLNVFHPDIISFLGAKKGKRGRKSTGLKHLQSWRCRSDKYYDLIKANADMYLFSLTRLNGFTGSRSLMLISPRNMTTWLPIRPLRSTRLRLVDLENEISKLQQESVILILSTLIRANRANPIEGKIIMSNLCSEIMQVQVPSKLNNKQEYEGGY